MDPGGGGRWGSHSGVHLCLCWAVERQTKSGQTQGAQQQQQQQQQQHFVVCGCFLTRGRLAGESKREEQRKWWRGAVAGAGQQCSLFTLCDGSAVSISAAYCSVPSGMVELHDDDIFAGVGNGGCNVASWLLQEALYIDVSNKRVRAVAADRGGAGEQQQQQQVTIDMLK